MYKRQVMLVNKVRAVLFCVVPTAFKFTALRERPCGIDYFYLRIFLFYGFVEKVISCLLYTSRLSRVTDYIPTPSELMAMIKQEDLPIDPSDVAVNAYIQNLSLIHILQSYRKKLN